MAIPSPTQQYWLQVDGLPQGPFELSAICDKFIRCEITPDTFICPLGFHDWRRMSTIVDELQLSADTPNSSKLTDPIESSGIQPTTGSVEAGILLPVTPKPQSNRLAYFLSGAIVGASLALLIVWGVSSSSSGIYLAKKETKGATIRTESTLLWSPATMTLSANDKTGVATFDATTVTVTELEVLHVIAGEPTRLKMSTISDVDDIRIGFPDRPVHTEKKNGLFHGQSVLIEKVAGVWKQRMFDGIPNPVQTKALTAEWSNDDVYPNYKLAVGDTWTVNGPVLRKHLGMTDALSFSGTGTFTLLETTSRDKDRVALIHSHLEIKATVLNDNNQEQRFETTLSGHIYRSLTSFVDTESRMSGTMIVTDQGSDRGVHVMSAIVGPVNLTQHQQRIR